jgi:McbB family protein
MRLSIENYKLLNFNNDNLGISARGVSRTTPPSLLQAIRELQGRTSITEAELSRLVNEHSLDEAFIRAATTSAP